MKSKLMKVVFDKLKVLCVKYARNHRNSFKMTHRHKRLTVRCPEQRLVIRGLPGTAQSHFVLFSGRVFKKLLRKA